MNSTQSLDRAILAIVEEHQPASMKRIMDGMNRDHTRAGKSNRTAAERVYALKREGKLTLIGIGKDAQYTLPDYNPSATPTEAQHQAAEGRKREVEPAPEMAVVMVDDDLPDGWRMLREQLDSVQEMHEEIQQIMATPPSPAPIEPAVPPIVQRAPLSLSISALAGDVAAQVAMTVERVIGQDIRRYEAVIADLQGQITTKEYEIARMREELTAAEQLGAEAESKYNQLREKLRAL